MLETRINTLKIDIQRIVWLYTGSAAVFSIMLMFFGWIWDPTSLPHIWWVTGAMLIITVLWWYWALKVVLYMSENLLGTLRLAKSITADIAEIKQLSIEQKQNKKRDL